MKTLIWLALLTCTAFANPLGPQATLVMPIYFDEKPAAADVRALVNDADRLLRVNSSGLTWLEPLYVEPFHPSQPAEAYRGAEGMRRLRAEALAALTTTVPHLRHYRRQLLVVPAEFAGQASLGTVGYELMKCPQDEFYATTALVRYENTPATCGAVLLHELGHNFGFTHAEHDYGTFFSDADRASIGWPTTPLTLRP